ncbi:MAG TPA: hypothetical protein PLF40_11975, partial [Kofleriaceae bacterium]|nr:hypothetical protein [Kofleriaceae bacterium]
VIALNSAAGFAGSGMWHSIPIETIAGVVALAIAGSIVGSRIAQRISAAALREGFGWFIVVMAAFIASMEAPRQLGLTLSAGARGGVVATAVSLAAVGALLTAQRIRRQRG